MTLRSCEPVQQDVLIVHVVHSLTTGGLENGVVNLVNFPMPGVRHQIISMTPEDGLRYRLNPNVDCSCLAKAPGHDLRTFVTLVRLLRRIKPTVVHSRNWGTFDAILAARLTGVRTVVHGEHGRDIFDPDGRNTRRNRARRLFAPLVNCFVTVSQDLHRWLVEDVGLPPRKVITIHNGVDSSCFSPADAAAARAALGLAQDRVIIGTVGRLDPVKDQAGLIRAFARVRSHHPDTMLVIAGDGPCRSDLTVLTSSLGLSEHVRLLGHRRDIPLVLVAMDVFVLPSIAEGISNTILEAMATGLPTVATRVGGNPELIEEGVNGFLVRSRDPEALALAIGRYLDDPFLRTAHGKAARRRAIEQFSLDRMCTTYLNLYSRLGIQHHS